MFGPLCVQFPLPGMRLLWLFTWLPPAQQSGPSSDVTFLEMSSKVFSPTPLLSVTSTFLFPSRNYHDLEISCGFLHLLYIVCLSMLLSVCLIAIFPTISPDPSTAHGPKWAQVNIC